MRGPGKIKHNGRCYDLHGVEVHQLTLQFQIRQTDAGKGEKKDGDPCSGISAQNYPF